MSQVTKAANAAAAAGFAGRWTNPSNAYALTTDSTMATITNTTKNATYGDDYGFPNFGTGDIPDGATINSVVVNGYWGHNGTLNGCVLGLLPRLNGADAGTEYTYTSSGGSPQWETFTPVAFTSVPSLAQLRSASTLVKARIRGTRPNSTNPATFELDFVSITVDYTAGATTQNGNFSANAFIETVVSDSFSADADLLATVPNSFPADAVVLASSGTETFSADAMAMVPSGTKTFSADAFVLGVVVDGVPANAIVLAGSGELTFTSDAWVAGTVTDSFSADAVILASSGTITFTAQAIVYDPASLGAPTWVSPPNGEPMSSSPTLVFTMPVFTGSAHFHLELDKADTFDTGDLRQHYTYLDQTGWQYWNNSDWVAIPETGVPDTYAGNNARYTVSTPLTGGTWYRRVRAGV